MNWKNLKNNKCPKCNGSLNTVKPAPKTQSHISVIVCSKDCGFNIRPQRMSEIVAEQNAKRFNPVHNEEENLAALSNL